MNALGDEHRNLHLEIARCPLLLRQMNDESLEQPCAALIKCQSLDRDTHQVPEPWSGNLRTARILFFGSNPSINMTERFPTLAWTDDAVEDYFVRRFAGGSQRWVDDRLGVLLVDGTYGQTKSWVRYWAACRARATELLGRAAVPGSDFALSEVVHCKSKSEAVDGKAVTRLATVACSERYTMRIVAASPAKIVCVMGDVPGAEFRRLLNVSSEERLVGPVPMSGVDRRFVFLDHPAGPGSRRRSSMRSARLMRRRCSRRRTQTRLAAKIRPRTSISKAGSC